jgi:hypothetical protein
VSRTSTWKCLFPYNFFLFFWDPWPFTFNNKSHCCEKRCHYMIEFYWIPINRVKRKSLWLYVLTSWSFISKLMILYNRV